MRLVELGVQSKYFVMKSPLNDKWALATKSTYGRSFADGQALCNMFGVKYEDFPVFMEQYGAEVVEKRVRSIWLNRERVETAHVTWNDWRKGMEFIHEWIEPLILMKHMSGGKK